MVLFSSFLCQALTYGVGEVVEATIKEVKDFGLILELAPGVTTVLPNKHLAHQSVSVSAVRLYTVLAFHIGYTELLPGCSSISS